MGNTLYGTTFQGGDQSLNGGYGYGAVFDIPVSGGTPATLSAFNYSNGGFVYAGLTLGGSNFYGATTQGGNLSLNHSQGYGVVYEVPVSGGAPTVLATFNGTNGSSPESNLTLVGDTLYGTCHEGGVYGYGNVFSVPVSGGSVTVLASFNGPNGAYPLGALTVSGSTLYGTTAYGGSNFNSNYGLGTVFSLPLTGGTPTSIGLFNNANGATPVSSLILSGNTLYGTAEAGGAHGQGTVFSLPISGGTPVALASFSNSNGSAPLGDLALVGDKLYGTTGNGGNLALNNGYGDGTVFSVPVSGGSLTVLATFNGSNGSTPYSGLTYSDNKLFGTTTGGGLYNQGTVFSVTLPAPEPSTLSLIGALCVAGIIWRLRWR
jgi:uncharacterized repeat protein (TIGR03803 family)